jgi:hypothetical protein
MASSSPLPEGHVARTKTISQTNSRPIAARDRFDLRDRIIEEHYLRQAIAREEALRRDRPDLWRHAEAGRMARNRQQTELNRRLRAAGCRPVSTEPSLKQKVKKLQQLEARNRAETASPKRSA